MTSTEMQERIACLERELAAARATARRLNRRAQWAESCATRVLNHVTAHAGSYGGYRTLTKRLWRAQHYYHRCFVAFIKAGVPYDVAHDADRAAAMIIERHGLAHAVQLVAESDAWRARCRHAWRVLGVAVRVGKEIARGR